MILSKGNIAPPFNGFSLLWENLKVPVSIKDRLKLGMSFTEDKSCGLSQEQGFEP